MQITDPLQFSSEIIFIIMLLKYIEKNLRIQFLRLLLYIATKFKKQDTKKYCELRIIIMYRE